MAGRCVAAYDRDQAGGLHFLMHGSAVFVYMAAAGEVQGVAVVHR